MRFLLYMLLGLGGTAPAAVYGADCVGINAIRPECKSAEIPYYRDVFFVGGEYLPYSNISQSIPSDQIYVEKLTPLGGANQTHPLVFISAGIPSSAVWLNTPDNRKGWASYFIDQGYQIYIADVIGNGRSGQNDVARFPLRYGATDNVTQDGFTAPERANYYPQAVGHDKWPGTGLRGDPIFDAFEFSMIPFMTNATSGELAMRAAGCVLLGLVGESFTFCHSSSCQFTTLWSDQCPELIRATINIEPTVIPFQAFLGNATAPGYGRTPYRPYGLTTTPITYDPPITSPSELNPVEVGPDDLGHRSCFLQAANSTIHTLPQIAKVPFIMYTGSASPHITYDHCVADYLEQTQVPYEWIKLSDLDILGNGHFLFLETNSLDIAAIVAGKLSELSV